MASYFLILTLNKINGDYYKQPSLRVNFYAYRRYAVYWMDVLTRMMALRLHHQVCSFFPTD